MSLHECLSGINMQSPTLCSKLIYVRLENFTIDIEIWTLRKTQLERVYVTWICMSVSQYNLQPEYFMFYIDVRKGGKRQSSNPNIMHRSAKSDFSYDCVLHQAWSMTFVCCRMSASRATTWNLHTWCRKWIYVWSDTIQVHMKHDLFRCCTKSGNAQ